jgi:serine/threonine protein kinase
VAESASIVRNEVVGGRYRLGEVIGRGGMSSVYCARDGNLGRDVALKLLAPQAPDVAELRRQQAEIKLLATLNHPCLVTLFDAGIDTRIPEEPRPFLTMELVEGQDLRGRIRHSPVPLNELAVIGAGVADALAYVHSRGIIHRDVKPANILLVQVRPGEPLRAKLTDFGIARIADGTRLTATGAMVGTAAYLSPEQALGSPLSPATDVYSLGLVLLESIKQAMEYPGGAVESAVARLHRVPEIPDDLPEEWANLIRSMTAIDPLERPAPADIEIALRRALVSPASTPGELAPESGTNAGQPRPAGANGPPGRPPETRSVPRQSRARRRRRRHWPVVAPILLALAGGAVALAASPSPQPTSDVVPYPTVTGTLGEQLQELQKSVEP